MNIAFNKIYVGAAMNAYEQITFRQDSLSNFSSANKINTGHTRMVGISMPTKEAKKPMSMEFADDSTKPQRSHQLNASDEKTKSRTRGAVLRNLSRPKNNIANKIEEENNNFDFGSPVYASAIPPTTTPFTPTTFSSYYEGFNEFEDGRTENEDALSAGNSSYAEFNEFLAKIDNNTGESSMAQEKEINRVHELRRKLRPGPKLRTRLLPKTKWPNGEFVTQQPPLEGM